MSNIWATGANMSKGATWVSLAIQVTLAIRVTWVTWVTWISSELRTEMKKGFNSFLSLTCTSKEISQ